MSNSNITVWRIHLKTEPTNKKLTLKDVQEFCRKEKIIGVGWQAIDISDYNQIESMVDMNYEEKERKSAQKAITAISQMKEGDLVWTRTGGDETKYFLCRVGKKIWEERNITKKHREYDVCNFVSAEWIELDSFSSVPGKILNSFCLPRTVQRVNNIEETSKIIWNENSNGKDKYEISLIDSNTFWNCIQAEELECLIMLYLQSEKDYYLYSSTIKKSTKGFEAVLIHKEWGKEAYLQVKSGTKLNIDDYKEYAKSKKIFLFSTSECKGEKNNNIECISIQEMNEFLNKFKNNSNLLLPEPIKNWFRYLKD